MNNLQKLNSKSGKIKTRIFAFILLVLSLSLLLTSYKSLNREFKGIIVKKSSSSGLTKTHYWLSILPEDMINASDTEAILNALSANNSPQRIGVSEIVHTEARPFNLVSKKRLSPFILLGETKHIDLGVLWFIFGLAGITGSFAMYYQTLKKGNQSQKYETEELEF